MGWCCDHHGKLPNLKCHLSLPLWASSKSTIAMMMRCLLMRDDYYEIFKKLSANTGQVSLYPLCKMRVLFLIPLHRWEDRQLTAVLEGSCGRSRSRVNPCLDQSAGLCHHVQELGWVSAHRCPDASCCSHRISSPAPSDPDFTEPFSTRLQLDVSQTSTDAPALGGTRASEFLKELLLRALQWGKKHHT